MRVLYRGYFANLLNMCTKRALQIPLTGAITSAVTGETGDPNSAAATCCHWPQCGSKHLSAPPPRTGGVPRRLSNTEQMVAAWGGGFVSAFFVSPMELLMIQQQRFGTSLASTPKKLLSMGQVGLLLAHHFYFLNALLRRRMLSREPLDFGR